MRTLQRQRIKPPRKELLMNDKAEKVYAQAFFELCREQAQGKERDMLTELDALDGIFTANPDLAKLMDAPTVPAEEKVGLLREMISAGGICELCGNLLCVIAEKGRFGCFSGIVKHFRELCNDFYKIAEITVTSSEPLTEELKDKIKAKMSEITGKNVSIKEKTDPSIIGGVIIDYGSTRYDGSVKARLGALKKELGSVIA